jgi:hypothetical protein
MIAWFSKRVAGCFGPTALAFEMGGGIPKSAVVTTAAAAAKARCLARCRPYIVLQVQPLSLAATICRLTQRHQAIFTVC